jgi:hypothetical protein
MRAGVDRISPDPSGVLKDKAAFFRRGTSGAGLELLSENEVARYRARLSHLAAPEVIAWLHRDVQPT